MHVTQPFDIISRRSPALKYKPVSKKLEFVLSTLYSPLEHSVGEAKQGLLEDELLLLLEDELLELELVELPNPKLSPKHRVASMSVGGSGYDVPLIWYCVSGWMYSTNLQRYPFRSPLSVVAWPVNGFVPFHSM